MKNKTIENEKKKDEKEKEKEKEEITKSELENNNKIFEKFVQTEMNFNGVHFHHFTSSLLPSLRSLPLYFYLF